MYASLHILRDAVVLLVVAAAVAAAWILGDYGIAAAVTLAAFVVLALGIPLRVIRADEYRDLHQLRRRRQ